MNDHHERLKQELKKEREAAESKICKPGVFRGPHKGDVWMVRDFIPGYAVGTTFTNSNSLGGNIFRISSGKKFLIVEAGVPDPVKRPWAGTWTLVTVEMFNGLIWISEKRWYELPVPFQLVIDSSKGL